MRETTIKITQELIDTSIRRSSTACVVVEAIYAKYPWARNVMADLQTIRFSDFRGKESTGVHKRIWYLTPRSVQRYIILFDHGDPIKPFDFRLKQPTIVDVTSKLKDDAATVNTTGVIKLGTPNKKRNHHKKLSAVEITGGPTPPRSNHGRRTYGIRGLVY